MKGISPTSMVVGVIALVAIVAAFIFGLYVKGDVTAQTTPMVMAVVGLVAPTVTAFVALLKVEATQDNVKETQNTVAKVKDSLENGLIPAKMQEFLNNPSTSVSFQTNAPPENSTAPTILTSDNRSEGTGESNG